MKKIGILGGISLASTIQYYKTITDLYFQQAGDYYYPEIFIHSLDFQYFTDLEDQNRMEEYRHYILSSLHALKNAGADFGIMAANSPHSVLDDIRDQANLPILSIVDAVGRGEPIGVEKAASDRHPLHHAKQLLPSRSLALWDRDSDTD